MKTSYTMLLTASALYGFALSAHAVDTEDVIEDRAEAAYEASTERAKATYESAKDRCDALSGNAEDVCDKKAEAEYEAAIAEAKVALKTGEARADTIEDEMEARYEAERERCDALSGDAKDACISDARLKFNQ